jgi:DNA-binding NtrC family response regulator
MSKAFIIDSSGDKDAHLVRGSDLDVPMLGLSPAMKKLKHLVEKVAPTDSNVLITGETGTGKEMLARAIHALSPRRDKPFVAVNASAIPESLQESELFGHRKGAFTGAIDERKGLFEEAGSGTLFLDEIGDCSPSLQVKLLRAIESRVIRRVGEGQERPVDLRILAATNRDLVELVRRGDFREDLFFRLNVVQLHLPPLRERGEDLGLLLDSYLKRHCARQNKRLSGYSPEARSVLESYAYPGNIRELDNIVHHAVLMADGQEILPADLPPYLFSRPRLGAASLAPAIPIKVIEEGSSPHLELGGGFMTLAEMEKSLIESTLKRLGRNQSLASKKLGISRSTLWRKMKEYGFEA